MLLPLERNESAPFSCVNLMESSQSWTRGFFGEGCRLKSPRSKPPGSGKEEEEEGEEEGELPKAQDKPRARRRSVPL